MVFLEDKVHRGIMIISTNQRSDSCESIDFLRPAPFFDPPAISVVSQFTEFWSISMRNSVALIFENSKANEEKNTKCMRPRAHSHPSVMFAQNRSTSGSASFSSPQHFAETSTKNTIVNPSVLVGKIAALVSPPIVLFPHLVSLFLGRGKVPRGNADKKLLRSVCVDLHWFSFQQTASYPISSP